MKIKNKDLEKRYKKLNQPDRMEYLSIESKYENRDNSYNIAMLLSMGIKGIFLVILILICLSGVSLISITDDISEEQAFKNVIDEIDLYSLISSSILAFVIMFDNLLILVMMFLNQSDRKKILNEYLNDRDC